MMLPLGCSHGWRRIGRASMSCSRSAATQHIDRVLRRVRCILTRADRGSGTMAGVALIIVVGVLLAATASAGNLLLCQTRAQSAADLAAISAAVAVRNGTADSCAVARSIAVANGASLDSCVTDVEDVQVSVSVSTQVPFAPYVSRSARAGPVSCG